MKTNKVIKKVAINGHTKAFNISLSSFLNIRKYVECVSNFKMNDEAKIQLSTVEMELANNTEWIFTKQLLIEKVNRLFWPVAFNS